MKIQNIHWSFDVKGTEDSIHIYFRYRRNNQPDNEIGIGIELMPRKWKATHHRTMCRFNLFLWVIGLWFDYPYPIKPYRRTKTAAGKAKINHDFVREFAEESKPRYCLRCNKLNPDPKEDCWVGEKLFTQNPVPHIFKK